MKQPKVLVFTHMYPSAEHPESGVFIKEQVEALLKEGADVEVLDCDVKRSKLIYFKSIFRFWKQLLTKKYDIVHAHYVFAGIVARMQIGIPVIITHHGDETFHTYQKYLCWIISRLVKRTIVVSQEMKEAIGLESSEIIPCGVDFEKFSPTRREECRNKLGLDPEKKYVLYAGDISKQLKRFDLVESAVKILQAKRQDVELLLAYKQPYEMMPVYMNAADVFLFPSEREGSPQVIKEAMACNLPIVAAPVGDVPAVFDGVHGCYLAARNAEEIAERAYYILDNVQRSNGRTKIANYEGQYIARKIMQVYSSLVK